MLKKNKRITTPKFSITVASSRGYGAHRRSIPQDRAAEACKWSLWELGKGSFSVGPQPSNSRAFIPKGKVPSSRRNLPHLGKDLCAVLSLYHSAGSPTMDLSNVCNILLLKLGEGFCCSVTQSCPALCNPMNCSTPGFPVLHCLLKVAQTHVHRVRDAIQPSHPLLPLPLLPSVFPSIRVCSRESAQWLWCTDLVAPCGFFPDQGSNPCLLHCQVDSLPLSHQGNSSYPYSK